MADKKTLTEEDIKHRYITPAIHAAGWKDDLIFMEKYFTAGRITIHGRRTKRGEGRKADAEIQSALDAILEKIGEVKFDAV